MADGVLRIHFLVPSSNGAVHSNPIGKPFPIGSRSDYRVACDASIVMGDLNRGTHEPWGVRCNACMATVDFKRLNRPKPTGNVPDMTEETKCCGDNAGAIGPSES